MVQAHLNVGSRMIIGDYCLGSLNIGSVDSGEPDPGNAEFLRQVATQIAFAIVLSGPMRKLTGCATGWLVKMPIC